MVSINGSRVTGVAVGGYLVLSSPSQNACYVGHGYDISSATTPPLMPSMPLLIYVAILLSSRGWYYGTGQAMSAVTQHTITMMMPSHGVGEWRFTSVTFTLVTVTTDALH